MRDWSQIDSVFLDMDGTLLDLHYDNSFWLHHVPLRYAEKHGITFEESHTRLTTHYGSVAGTLNWYCMDFWTRELGLDIVTLTRELSHLIAVHPHVVPFLERMRASGKHVALVTNAHRASIALKMECTDLEHYFGTIICSHDVGVPKEDPAFWRRLGHRIPYDPARTLLVEDSLSVLRSARQAGIAQLVAVRRPDSRKPENTVEEFDSIADFAEL